MIDDQNNSAALNLGPHYEAEDLLLYVLAMLSAKEREAMETHVHACELCRQELAAVQEEMGVFAVASVGVSDVEAVTPPVSSRNRLLAEVGRAVPAATPAAIPAASAVTPTPALGLVAGGKLAPRTGHATRIAPWLGWGIAAALALAATHFYQNQQTLEHELGAQMQQIAQLQGDAARAREIVSALTDSSAQRVTLNLTKAAAPPQPSGRATYLADKGTLIFLASHLEQLPAGKTYELWVIPASGAAPIPAGTFRPDERGNANVVTAKLEGAGAAKAFGITIEPEGGSSTPTMPIVLAGS